MNGDMHICEGCGSGFYDPPKAIVAEFEVVTEEAKKDTPFLSEGVNEESMSDEELLKVFYADRPLRMAMLSKAKHDAIAAGLRRVISEDRKRRKV